MVPAVWPLSISRNASTSDRAITRICGNHFATASGIGDVLTTLAEPSRDLRLCLTRGEATLHEQRQFHEVAETAARTADPPAPR